MDPNLIALQTLAGVHFMGQPNMGFVRHDEKSKQVLAMDAQPQLVTASNSGVPAFLSTFIDPKVIDILVAPMKAAIIVGDETKKGDWTMTTAEFPVAESTGETSSYGDYSENGRAGSNVNWINRQSYHYQVFTEWGERELEMMGLGKIDWANRQQVASVLTLNKFQNKSYFFGVAGLENYGLLNDPNLYAPISPLVQNGVTQWSNPAKDALGVLADVSALYTQLQLQANGLVDLETSMTLAMSPTAQVGLTKTTAFNVNVMDLLKKNYPNMKVETAPEYATAGGQFVQLIATEIEGQRTATTAFTEKLRAHPIIVGSSSFKQKKSQGTWGTIIYRPFLVASMLGV
jgi:hypothetical protein